MSIIKELQQLIQTDSPVSGRVISVSNTNVVVATASGQMEVSASSDLRIGDMVIVDAGLAIKKQRGSDAPADIPHTFIHVRYIVPHIAYQATLIERYDVHSSLG